MTKLSTLCLTAFTLVAFALPLGAEPAPSFEDSAVNSLPLSEGSAQDLQGTLAKDASLWLGGVGGGDELTEDEVNVYQIHQSEAEDGAAKNFLTDGARPGAPLGRF
ncbi:MAG: hypothetical protein ACK5CA_09035 [Cyanobacteriota bacterium]|jgi:hypothetical protein